MFDFYDGVKIMKDKTSKPIAIEWRFSDGSKQYYYLKEEDKEWFEEFVQDVLKENALSRKERYHSEFSLDDCPYEGETFIDHSQNPALHLNNQEEQKMNSLFYKNLTRIQKRRLNYKLDNPKTTYQAIAEKENTTRVAIFKSFVQIRKNYEKFINSF